MHIKFCSNINKLTSLLSKKGERKGTAAALLLSALVLYSGLTIAWAPYTGPYRTIANSYSTISPAAMEPNVWVDAIIPQSVTYSQVFDLVLMVGNSGNTPAGNVHILYKASPGGFFTIQNVDQPSYPIGQDSEDVSLGTLAPNTSQEINFMLQVPTQAQLSGLWSPNFKFDFTATYAKGLTSYAGCVKLLIKHGQLLLAKKGFSTIPPAAMPIQPQSAQTEENTTQSPDSYLAPATYPPFSSYFTPMRPSTPETYWQGGSS